MNYFEIRPLAMDAMSFNVVVFFFFVFFVCF